MKTYFVDVKKSTLVTYRVLAESKESAEDHYLDGEIIHTEYLGVVDVEVEEAE